MHDGEGGRSKDECSNAEISGKLLVSAADCVTHLNETFTRSVKFENSKHKDGESLYGKKLLHQLYGLLVTQPR